MNNEPTKNKVPPAGYGKSFTDDNLIDHWKALIDLPVPKTREELLLGLFGTEFDEHAFS